MNFDEKAAKLLHTPGLTEAELLAQLKEAAEQFCMEAKHNIVIDLYNTLYPDGLEGRIGAVELVKKVQDYHMTMDRRDFPGRQG